MVIRDLDPCPEERLSAAELARAARDPQAYHLCAVGGVGCIWEAARIVGRLEFTKFLVAAGQLHEGQP